MEESFEVSMIKNLSLTNFQSHRNSKIEFDPGFNVISGSSDSGKSSILRALMWVIKNRPTGEGIKNWDTDEKTVAEIVFEGGTVRKERDSKTVYFVDKTKLEAVGTDVPSEIEELVNFSEFSYQSQHSPYFLLTDSPGEVARKLNDLVGLSIIDRIFKNLASKATTSKRIAEEERNKVSSLSLEIDKLSYLERAEKDINKINLLLSKAKEKEDKVVEISSLVTEYNSLSKKISNYDLLLSLDLSGKFLLKEAEKFKELHNKYTKVSYLVTNMKEIENKLASDKEWLEVEICKKSIEVFLTNFNTKKNELQKIKKLVSDLQSNTSSWFKAKETLEKLREEHTNLLKKVKVCPFCKTKLNESKIKEMSK